ncbi:hypothetical protein FACS1894158_06750 [Betaproteobacteria bacterium]|nr:hypothetical protein FACS1894158_06750 [Betaproteobacteria bacterium]
MSALAYALTLVSLLPTILNFNGSFITVIAEQNELDKKAEIFNDLISMVIYIGFGVTAFMLMAGQSIVQLVLEHGAFTEDNTVSVARAISAYAWMIVPIFLISLLDQVFQVEQRIGFMVRRTVLGLLTNAFLSALFLFGMGWGLFGVALATSISYWVMLLSGLAGLKNVGYPLEKRKHLRWGAWNAPALLLAYIVFASLPAPFNSSLGGVSAAIFLVGGAMLLAGLSWRGREQQLIISTVRRCLPRKS